MKVWRLFMWFLLWVFYSFFFSSSYFALEALEKLSINVKTIWILFYCRTSFGQHYYFHLYVRYWWRKGRFYGSICWKFTRIYIFVKRRPNKAVSLIMLKCKSAQNHNFYDTSYSLTASRNIQEHSQVIEIWVRYIVVCIYRLFSVILTITTATAIKIAYEVSSRAGTAISFEISFSRNFTEKIFFFWFILFVQRIQNSRAKYKQLR